VAGSGDLEGRSRVSPDTIRTSISSIRALTACVAAAALAALPASAAAPPWTTLTVAKHAGPVSAVMTIQRRARGAGFYDYRKLRLVVRVDGRAVVDRLLCSDLRCGPGSHHDLALQNVSNGALREPVMSVYTGGAHCCFETLVALVDGPLRGRVLDKNWGDPGYKGQLHDGQYEFVSADDRFAYRFTSFAASGLPVQVWTIDPRGHFADVTRSRLDLVRSDARQWWRAYVSQRGKADGDIRGVLAAWCADEDRLGARSVCTAELDKALPKGWLVGPNVWPQNAAYVTAVRKMLAKWGYAS
jgi:hypothetical protein